MDRVHVVPIDDLREHEQIEECWCSPVIEHHENGDVVIHNSMDRREEYENGRKLS